MDKKNTQKAVEKWLQQQGYPLEMEVSKVFMKSGYGVRQSPYFTDPETETPRELDVLAFKGIRGKINVELQFVIQCKWSSFPFIVFSYPRIERIGVVKSFHHGGKIGKEYLQKLERQGVMESLPIYWKKGVYGYQMKQAWISGVTSHNTSRKFRKNKDASFEALITISKYIYTFTQMTPGSIERKSIQVEEGKFDSLSIPHLLIPLIVVDAPLFECFLDEDNVPKVDEIEHAWIGWYYPPIGNIPIQVCRKNFVPEIASRGLATLQKLNELNIPA